MRMKIPQRNEGSVEIMESAKSVGAAGFITASGGCVWLPQLFIHSVASPISRKNPTIYRIESLIAY